jgi:hypothetical protein
MHTGRGARNSTPAGKVRESSVVKSTAACCIMTAATLGGKRGNMNDCKHGQKHLTKRTREGSPEDENERYKT